MLMGAYTGPPAPAATPPPPPWPPRRPSRLVINKFLYDHAVHVNNIIINSVIMILISTLIFSSSSSSSSSTWGPLLLAHGAPVDDDATTTTAALLRFKSSLSYVKAFDTWNPSVSPSPCAGNYGTWRGVLCSNGVVWGLQLENMQLTGQIDVDALVPLRSLRTISLMNNSFEGPMPDWNKLGALKSLFLSNNHFTGPIPQDAFKAMSSLKKVYLANNKFTGNIPATLSTPRLLELRLENNQFTGPIPHLKPGLKSLNVSNNQLQGPIPPTLAKLDPSSFAGNSGMCGPPLAVPCNSPGPLPDQKPDSPTPAPSPSADSAPADQAAIADKQANSSHVSRTVIVVMAILVALIAIVVIIAIYRRSKKETPRLGKVVTSPPSGKHSSNGSNSGSSAGKNATMQVGLPQHEPYKKQTMGAVGQHVIPNSAAVSPEMIMNSTTPAAAANAVTASSRKTKAEATNKLSFVREDRQKFDLQDLLRASAEVLGSGNFGSSYKAVLMDGQAVVVKRFKQMSNVGKEDFHEHMRRLGRLVHPNLLPLVAYYYRKEEKLLVFDYVHNGSLATHLHGNHSAEQPALDWPTRLKIVKGVAKGLAYLHNELPSVSLPHGHLKSSNVVLDKSFQPLLMDYALVTVVNPQQVQHLLVAYKSPEYVQHGRTTRKTDVWNLGILILEILTSNFPANYITASSGMSPSSSYSYKSSEVAGWINSIKAAGNGHNDDHDQLGGCISSSSSFFDKEMGNTDNGHGEMWKLLQIGVGCCEDDADNRWDLKEAVERIEHIKERDHI